jgi:hypothetical protein
MLTQLFVNSILNFTFVSRFGDIASHPTLQVYKCLRVTKIIDEHQDLRVRMTASATLGVLGVAYLKYNKYGPGNRPDLYTTSALPLDSCGDNYLSGTAAPFTIHSFTDSTNSLWLIGNFSHPSIGTKLFSTNDSFSTCSIISSNFLKPVN